MKERSDRRRFLFTIVCKSAKNIYLYKLRIHSIYIESNLYNVFCYEGMLNESQFHYFYFLFFLHKSFFTEMSSKNTLQKLSRVLNGNIH